MGKLYLIPVPLGEYEPSTVLPSSVLELLPRLKIFVCEQIRTARRFLSSAGLKGHIQELDLHELNEHSAPDEGERLAALLEKGDVGLMSEAGLPAVADPGALLVAACQRRGIEVIPMVGPSSLMLALMASGLNGQSFAFCGYVSAKSDRRRSELKEIEKQSLRLNQTQIIIETPYRNDALFQDMLSCLSPATRLCLAADITLPEQFIRTKSVAQWKKTGTVIGKRPCVFLILA